MKCYSAHDNFSPSLLSPPSPSFSKLNIPSLKHTIIDSTTMPKQYHENHVPSVPRLYHLLRHHQGVWSYSRLHQYYPLYSSVASIYITRRSIFCILFFFIKNSISCSDSKWCYTSLLMKKTQWPNQPLIQTQINYSTISLPIYLRLIYKYFSNPRATILQLKHHQYSILSKHQQLHVSHWKMNQTYPQQIHH